MCAHCQGRAWPSSSHHIPTPLCNSQVAGEAKTPTSGRVWGGPWLRRPVSRPPSGATQRPGAGRQHYGPHCPQPQADLTISSLKPQAADQLPQASPQVHPKSRQDLWAAVFSGRECVMRRKNSGKNTEHCDPRIPANTTICSLPTGPQLPNTICLPCLEASGKPMPHSQDICATEQSPEGGSEHPWLQGWGLQAVAESGMQRFGHC